MRRIGRTARAAVILLLAASAAVQVAAAAVGRTPGSASVSATGRSTYAIPLWTPAGAGDLGPSLSLVYASNNSSPSAEASNVGLLGVGFGIRGLSAVTRCAKTIAQDAGAVRVQLSSADVFCLDGNRLRRTSAGSYGAPNTTYQTELERYARVTSFGTLGDGPEWFEVRTADGLIYEYGNSADSRDVPLGAATVRTWMLSAIRDRVGNRATYSWTRDSAAEALRIHQVDWATNSTAGLSSAPYSARFIYAARPDPIYEFDDGYPANTTVRLQRVEIAHQGAIVRQYVLSFDTGGAGGRSRLVSLQECAATTADCLAATTFTWTPNAAGFLGSTAVGTTVSQRALVMDVDGDGRDDLVYASNASGTGTWRIRRANGSGGFDPESDTSITTTTGSAQALIADWDGDGRADLYVPYPSGTWTVLRSNGAGFDVIGTSAPTTGASALAVRAFDVNGDGRDDLVRLSTSGAATVYVRYRGAAGFDAAETQVWTSNDPNISFIASSNPFGLDIDVKQRTPQRRADFDGDGREDFVALFKYSFTDPETGWTSTEYWASPVFAGVPSGTLDPGAQDLGGSYSFGDLNGDGYTDIVWNTSAGYKLVFNQGAGLFGAPILGPATGSYYAATAMLNDYDGDGRDDLVVASAATGTWHVARGTGTGFASPSDTYAAASAGAAFAAELDGDGRADIVLVAGAGAVSTRLHAVTQPELLASATDGFGVAATFAYAPLTDSTVYTKGAGAAYPLRDLRDARYVVKQLTQTDGTGTGSTFATTYTYAGARTDLEGRGFVGFANRTHIDGSAGYNVKTIEIYRQEFPYVGALQSRETQQASGTRISLLTNTWTSVPWGTPRVDERRYPYTSSSTLDRHEAQAGGTYNGTKIATVTTNVTTIDGTSGLITDSTTTTTETASGLNPSSSRSERLWHTSVLNDTSNWCLGRPQATSRTASHTIVGGGAITRTSDATWSGQYCRPSQVRTQPGDAQWQVTVDLLYDDFGNVRKQTVTGAGMAPRETELSYGARGQFPLWIKNALNQVTTQEWNYAYGVPTLVTDPNGLPTSWAYDSFARQTLETRPDITSTQTTYTTCSGCESRVKWIAQVQPRNTGGVAIRTDTQHFDQFDRIAYEHRVLANGGTSVAGYVTYDARGRPSRTYVPYWSGWPHNGYWQASYDVVDRPTARALYTAANVIDRQAAITYDGLSTLEVDELGNATRRYVSAWGDLVRISDAAGGSTNHQSDAFGNLTRVTDAYQNESLYVAYNVRGMRTSFTDMNLGAWTIVPNALGEVMNVRDAKTAAPGWTRSFSYDSLGRILSRTEPEGTSNWTWGTSAGARNIGHLQAVSGPNYSESFTYTPAGKLQRRTISSDTTYHIDYWYNDLGALHTVEYPTSTAGQRFKVKYGYAYGYAASVREFTGDVDAAVLWSQTSVDPRGNPVDESYGNGLRVVSGYSPLTGLIDYRQAGVGGSTQNRQNLAYAWDKASNLKQRQDVSQGLTEIFYYDALNRIDYSTLNGTTNFDVALDLIGNITARTEAGATTTYSYATARKHAVSSTSIGGVQTDYQYDANGNMSQKSNPAGSTAITWTSYNLPSNIAFTPASGGGASPQPVNWTSPYCVATGPNGQITNNCGAWDANAASSQTLSGDGNVSFVPNNTGLSPFVNAMQMCLNSGSFSLSVSSSLEYCITVGAGYAAAYVNGSWQSDIIVTTSDTLKIAVESNVVRFYKNGTLFYTAGTAPSFPLNVVFASGYQGYGASQASIATGASAPPPSNLALNMPTTSEGSPCAANEGPEKAVNGSVSGGWSDKWCSLNATKWWQVDLGSAKSINQIVIKHAEAGGEASGWNTRDFNLQTSSDSATWTTVASVTGNTAATTTHPVSVTARYVRLNVITPTSTGDSAARIYEVEVYGPSGGGGTPSVPVSSAFLYTPERAYFRQTAVYTNGGSTTEYVGGILEKVAEGSGTFYRHMVPAGSGLVIVTRSTVGASEYRYVTRDHLGSVSLITNGSGAAEITASFAAYGARRQANWQAGAPDWSAIANATRRGYTDHTMLDNLALVHMNGRVYDPAIGRFLSADPIEDGLGEAGGSNRYAYVRNNPLALLDPSGLRSQEGTTSISRADDMADPEARHDANTLALLEIQLTNNGSIQFSAGFGLLPPIARDAWSRLYADLLRLLDFGRQQTDLASQAFGSDRSARDVASGARDFFVGASTQYLNDIFNDSGTGLLDGQVPFRFVEPQSAGGQLGATWGPFLSALGTRSIGAATGRGGEGVTRVGRWMSRQEFDTMSATGRVVEGAGGRTSVIRPPNPASFKPPPSSPIYAEFDVPTSVLRQGGRSDWAIIPGPNVSTRLFGPAPSQMPPATCIVCVIGK